MADHPLKYLRLSGLKTSDLPAASASAAELTPLITTLLQEALPLLNSVTSTTTDQTQWKSKGTKTFPESTAPVELSERVLASSSETWACRRSVHADAAVRGSASWAEFARCLRDEHAATEDAFTPTVLAHREARSWAAAAAAAAAADVPPVAVEGTQWGGFALVLVEMKHKVPPPLQPRVFAVLQLVARAVGPPAAAAAGGEIDEFVVVSVPVEGLEADDEMGVLSREKGAVAGAYAAVERVRRIIVSGGGDGDEPRKAEGARKGGIEWVMATASDARGVLPMWVQTKAIPGQIAKDVALFLGWIDGERKAGGGYGDGTTGATKLGGGQQPGRGRGDASTEA
ncbi:unnamed protein product [Discula destructiva]